MDPLLVPPPPDYDHMPVSYGYMRARYLLLMAPLDCPPGWARPVMEHVSEFIFCLSGQNPGREIIPDAHSTHMPRITGSNPGLPATEPSLLYFVV